MSLRVRFPRSFSVDLELGVAPRTLAARLKTAPSSPSRFTLKESSETGARFTRPITWTVWGVGVDVAFHELDGAKTLGHITWRPRFFPQLGTRFEAESDLDEISHLLQAASVSA